MEVIDNNTGELLTPQSAAKTIIQRQEQRKSMFSFFKGAFKIIDPGVVLQTNWHIDLICEYLEACYAREIRKLIINMPPRCLKSNTVTVAFPAWVLGQDPSERFLCSAYSSKLSTKHSVDTRLIIQSAWYRALFPKTLITYDQNEKMKFQTTERGHRIATSVGGTAIGEGGNFLISDDPINPKMAMSEVERESTNEWMDQSWSTRKNDPETSVEIIVMQRLHTNDPTGHILAEESDWEHLVLPQVAEKKQTIVFPRSGRIHFRKEGELLHPERISEATVEGYKKRLGSYGFAAQQQQRPSPLGGGIVKLLWFERYKTAPLKENCFIRLSFDTANKDKEQNDPSVCGIWLTNQNGHHLVDVWKERVLYPDLKRTAIALIHKWNPNEVLIEDKASGQQLIQDLKREMAHFAIIPMEPGGIDKITRMSNESPLIEAGGVWLPEQAPWLFDYEQEIIHFPNAPNDDQVDMTSQFLKRARAPSEIFIG